MRRLAILLITVALSAQAVAAPAPPPGPKRTKTVVVGLQGRRGVDPDLARALSDVLQSVLTEDTTRVVLGRDDIAQVVALEAEKQAMGCNDSSCLSEVATAMDADRIVTGTMDKVGSTFLITITEIDARKLEPVARVEATVPADESQLIDAVRKAARDLVGKSPRMGAGAPGGIVVTSTPPGAQILIDGKLLGTTPARLGPMRAGKYKMTLRPIGTPSLDVEAEVFGDGQTAVDVAVGNGTSLSPDAEREYKAKSTWNNIFGWSKVGVGGLCTLFGSACLCIGCVSLLPPTDVSVAAIMGGIGLVGIVPGIGLGAWGVLDVLNPPKPPGEEVAGSRVVITPPQGHGDPRSFEAPFTLAY